METRSEGWIVTNQDNTDVYEFTFSRTRSEATGKWSGLWNKPKDWNGHYKKGHRCVRAKCVITTYGK